MSQSRPAEQRLDATLLRGWPLPDHEHSDKRERGTVLVIGGTERTPGAVVLAGIAALRTGAGRLQIATAGAVATAVAIAVPEALVAPADDDDKGPLIDLVAAADAVVVGPGLVDRDQAGELVALVMEHARPGAVVVVDAVAIDALSALRPSLSARHGRLIITPNREELTSLLDDEKSDERAEVVAAMRYGAAVICFECVAAADGRVWIDDRAVRGLGTSGAGDVLAGVAGGAGARSDDAAQAACWAAAAHSAAGRRLAERFAPVGYLARQLADEVAPALAQLTT